jgi:hypothetical protein
MGLVRFNLNGESRTEDERRTLREALADRGMQGDHVVYDTAQPEQRLALETPLAQVEGRNLGVVEPATLG